MLAVIDYGAGNLRSVLHALSYLGVESMRVVQDPRDLRGADKIILPGVGAFGAGMAQLRKQDLVQPLRDAAYAGVPLLGICIGMQFLFERSDEMGDHEGLGIIPGYVTRIPKMSGLKIPHIGWNEIQPCRTSLLLDGLAPASYGYFVHSYHCIPANPDSVVAVTQYGSSICAMVEEKNVYGAQFHPEKSQKMGLQIYANFLKVPA